MIKLFSLMPDRLNLNGDQANLLVLQKRLAWLGVECEVVPVCSPQDMQAALEAAEADSGRVFLLIGHGSEAAMETIAAWRESIREWVGKLVNLGTAGLAVGSGYELLQHDVARQERVSEFIVAELREGVSGLGYVNSDAKLPVIELVGQSFVKTMLHGPVLAKNPHLADWFIRRLGVQVKANDRTEEIDAIVAKVWELEANH